MTGLLVAGAWGLFPPGDRHHERRAQRHFPVGQEVGVQREERKENHAL